MKRILLLLFMAATTSVLISQVAEMKWLYLLMKPLIMPSLLLYYLHSAGKARQSRMVVLAMVFSFAGDVLLMEEAYFTGGLIAFLAAHIFYIFAYRQHRFDEETDALQGIHRIRLAFPVVLAGTGLLVIIYPAADAHRLPVVIYATAITAMTLTALFRYGRTESASFWRVFAGAVLFMISDSLIAINKFLIPVPLGGFLVMLTYSSAQLLIITGLLRHEDQHQN